MSNSFDESLILQVDTFKGAAFPEPTHAPGTPPAPPSYPSSVDYELRFEESSAPEVNRREPLNTTSDVTSPAPAYMPSHTREPATHVVEGIVVPRRNVPG
jgi:hypothetical protein